MCRSVYAWFALLFFIDIFMYLFNRGPLSRPGRRMPSPCARTPRYRRGTSKLAPCKMTDGRVHVLMHLFILSVYLFLKSSRRQGRLCVYLFIYLLIVIVEVVYLTRDAQRPRHCSLTTMLPAQHGCARRTQTHRIFIWLLKCEHPDLGAVPLPGAAPRRAAARPMIFDETIAQIHP